MYKHGLLVFILVFSFFIAQCQSTTGAVAMMAALALDEDIDDLSLEDIITVDPFVGNSSVDTGRFEKLLLSVIDEYADLRLLAYLLPKRNSKKVIFTRMGLIAADMPKNLWLQNRCLRL